MGRIAEFFEKLKAAGVAFLSTPPPEPVPEQPDPNLLRFRVSQAEQVLSMMNTEGWKIYVENVRNFRSNRVDEMLNLPATAGESARCLHQGLTKGLDDAIEVAAAIVTAGEMAEDTLGQLVSENERREEVKKKSVARRV